MGCSASNRKDLQEHNEFYREAMGFKKKNLKGLRVDENLERIKTQKNINSDNLFAEELIDHADESGVVKPWLTNIVAPEHEIEEDLNPPKYTIKLEHIFGFRVEDCRQNLFYLQKDELLYVSSSLGIIQNIDDLSQTLFGGFATKEDRECHDNDIMSLAFYQGDVSMVATGQRGMKPMILVWSPLDTSVIYAKFHQPKGSKEVSALDFDKDGHYLASFGKDAKNTFYVFDMQTKSMYWKQETDPVAESSNKNEFLLDVAFNPEKDEICLVGVNKIIFGYLQRKITQNQYKKAENDDTPNIFTSVCYINKSICLIGSDKGVIRIYKDNKFQENLEVSSKSGSIQNITYSKKFDKIYVTDSLGYVYILNSSDYKRLDKFKMNSIVKSLDVNEDEDIVMGLKNGDIIIKHYREPSKREVTFLKSHCEGSIGGIDFIPENRVITSGEDNTILLWNLRSKKCECCGMINPVIPNSNAKDPSEIYAFQPRNKSQAISYNQLKDHVAVGIDDGTVSIRQGMKKLDFRIKDVKIGEGAVTELKYTNYGDVLIVCCQTGEVALLNANEDYEIKNTLKIASYITNLDWDLNNKYIQAVTKSNEYIFIYVDNMTLTLVKDPLEVNSVEWPRITCKFGYTVQGVYMGSTDPDFVSCVCKANSKKIILSGDDDHLLNLYNYPTVCENPKVKRFRGHSGIIKRIVFSNDDEKIITIAEEDKAIILWSLNPQ